LLKPLGRWPYAGDGLRDPVAAQETKPALYSHIVTLQNRESSGSEAPDEEEKAAIGFDFLGIY